MSIVSLYCQEYSRAENIQSDNVFYSQGLEKCYTEDDVRYHVETAGLTNLNAAETDKYQDSMEDCRTYCRHINTFTFTFAIREGSDSLNICLCRETYEEAAYFTYNQNEQTNNYKKCMCKADHDLDVSREDASGRVSGNVQCCSDC